MNRDQRGDTIVEVLICIAVIALVLVGAFAVSNHSAQTVQDSAEHTQAQQILQGQIESLRAYVTANATPPTPPFCMSNITVKSAGPPTPDPLCTQQPGGVPYHISIDIPSANTYHASVTWDSILGTTAKEDFYYQIYPNNL